MNVRTLISGFNTRFEDPENGGGEGAAAPAGAGAPAGDSGVDGDDSALYSELATHQDNSGDDESAALFDEGSGAGGEPAGTPPAPPSAAAPAAGATPTPGAAPAAAPAAPAATAAATPPAPPAQPAATPPAAPSVEGQPPAPGAEGTPPAGEQPVDFAKHRADFLPKLEQLYVMTEEETTAFNANPAQELPKLAAKLHYEVMLATHNAVVSVLPALMDVHQNQRSETAKRTEAFFGRWPALKAKVEGAGTDIKPLETIVNSIKAYRTANPKADEKTVIEQAGLLAAMSLGINPTEVAAPPPAGVVPAAPAAPAMPARPAGIAGVGHVPSPSQTPGVGGDVDEDLAGIIEMELSERRG